MKSFQVELSSIKNGIPIYICTMIIARSNLSAIGKAIANAKKNDCTETKHIQTFSIENYAENLPF